MKEIHCFYCSEKINGSYWMAPFAGEKHPICNSCGPMFCGKERVTDEADLWDRRSVPETPTGIAPCGHPGVHIVGQFMKCLEGCP